MASTTRDSLAKQNPLLFSQLKHHAIPFDQLTPELYLPRLKDAIAQAKRDIETIKANTDKPTFQNTIIALENTGEDIDLASNVFFNQLGANTNEKLQALAQEIGPLLSNYSSDISLDEKLFARIKAVYDSTPQLNVEETMLLDKYYSNFTRNGALLPASQKEELRAIDAEMSKLSPQFSENVLKATNDFQLIIENKSELEGLPESCVHAAFAAAKEKGLATDSQAKWLFTLHAPSYLPFMQFGSHRPSREKLYRAFNSRAFQDKYDNQNLVVKILELREKRAKLLGYKNHADFTLEKRMAESAEKVFQFLEKIKKASLPAAREDVRRVQEFARQNGFKDDLMPWDFGFWQERLKEHLFQYNAEDLRPYFQLENVIAGVFEHARRLYGLTFRESREYPTYHEDVKVYEVYGEASEYVGLFYADFFPRDSKNGGAWMTNYFEQGLFHREVHRPHVAIVCNFTKPLADKPSLITFDEVQTLFHEFGHALHSLLSQCRYRSLSGTNVYWDFVELPSQIMENWSLEIESLHLFAKHYQTGELLPVSLAQKIKESAKFMAGYQSLRQVTFAMLDMAWHTTPAEQIRNPAEFEEQTLRELRVLPKVDGTCLTCAFTHVFSGGYSAGYYSYKWAEVLDADAFELFQERGLFDRETAKKFKDWVLSRGGTEHPMSLYKKFRGREPDADALLKRDGLI
jgi:peptidyl-dipeptidase Dcp